MRGFRRTRDGYRCRLAPEEAFVVRRLAGELEALIAAETGGAAPPDPGPSDDLEAMVGLPATDEPPPRSADPVVARLFPDAYADDRDAAEFRRFTQAELAAGKRARLAAVRATLGEHGGDVRLDEQGAELWLTALGDLRLALGTRLGVTDETDDADDDAGGGPYAGGGPGPTEAALYAVYDLLSYLQETLVRALAGW